MSRARTWVIAGALSIIASESLPAGLPRMFNAQSGREAVQASQASGKPIVIYFMQAGCVWCERVERLLATSDVRSELIDSYHFVNVDIRQTNEPTVDALKKMFRVRGTPAFAFLSAKGEPICMVYGNIANDEELARIHATVRGLVAGVKPTVTARGFPSCRGKVTDDDSRTTAVQ